MSKENRDFENNTNLMANPPDSARNEDGILPFFSPWISGDAISEVVDTIKSGWVTTGPKVKSFEDKFANYIGAKNAIAVNSCTGALHLALEAAGIGDGDEVITSPFTFTSTANVIMHTGAKPVFVDIDRKTYNLKVGEVKKAINSNTEAVIPVHYAGQPCDMDPIMDIGVQNDLFVLEDAAHALAARYKGTEVGTVGHATAFSFYATKNLTTGEGGMVTTSNDELAEKIRLLSLHGMDKDAWKRYTSAGSWYYEVVKAGFKYNMTDIQAALGLHQLNRLNFFQKRRKRIAEEYNRVFEEINGLTTPYVKDEIKHAWHLYPLVLDPERLRIGRKEMINSLNDKNIGTSVHFIPLHLQPIYQERFGYGKGDFPTAERVYKNVLSLPLYPKMSDKDVKDVIVAVKNSLVD